MTTFPVARPDSEYASASRTCSSGNTLSTSGLMTPLSTSRAVQHHVTIFGHVFKTCAAVINGDVRAQTLHQFHIALPHRRENRRAQVTGQLDGHASNATAARVNQHPLVGAQPSNLH